jgi:AraC-like DNA-binding protein
MTLFAPTIGAFWQLLESYGLDANELFKKAGIDPDSMFDPGARVNVDAIEQVMAEGAQLSGDPDFALREADYFRPAHLGALGFAWLASSSLRVAFQRLSRFSRMINDDLKIELRESGDFLQVLFSNERPGLSFDLREQGQLVLAIKCCRVIAGDKFSPKKVSMQQQAPADTSSHFGYFRCPIDYAADCTSLVLSNPEVDKRLTGSNEELAQLNEHIVVKYLAHAEKNDIVNRCKAVIIDNLGSGGVTETLVAEALHTTSRNLHRKLQKEGTSFKLLLNEVRHDLALQYIKDRSMTLTEISFMLGFSEVSSFSRAFKNWTGRPPSEARQHT